MAAAVAPIPPNDPHAFRDAGVRELEGYLGRGAEHSWRVRLGTDELLDVVVEQDGVDVEVRLIDPLGEETVSDHPFGPRWVERMVTVTERAGVYRLVLATFPGSDAGRYRIRVERRPATRNDRRVAEAVAGLSECDELRGAEDEAGIRAAIERCEMAATLAAEAREPCLELHAHDRLGRLHNELVEPGEAVRSRDRALELHASCDDAPRGVRADLLNRRSWDLEELGDDAGTERGYVEAADIYSATGQSAARADVLFNLSGFYANQKRMVEALGNVRESVALYHRVAPRLDQAIATDRLAYVLHELGHAELAQRTAREALWLAGSDDGARGSALNTLGKIAREAGRLEDAQRYYSEMLAIRSTAGEAKGQATAHDGLATIRLRRGNWDAAERHLGLALELYERVGTRYDRGIVHFHLGELALRSRGDLRPGPGADPERAAAEFERALELLEAAGDNDAPISARFGLAVAQRELGNLEAARDHAIAAVAELEELRQATPAPTLGSTLMALYQDLFDFTVGLLVDLGDRREAFLYSELSRARTLLDSLERSTACLGEDARPLLVRRIEERDRMNEAWQRGAGSHRGRGQDRRGADEALWSALLALEMVDAELRDQARRAGCGPAAEPLELDRVQALLDDSTLLLSYDLGQERSFLWLVGSDRFAVRELGPAREIEQRARDLHNLLPHAHRRGRRNPAMVTAHELADLLLAPVADELGTSRLLIASEGALQFVPFAALPLPRPGSGEAAGFRTPWTPLLARHEVVRLPSASVLAAIRNRLQERSPAPGLLAVVADPSYGEEAPGAVGSPPLKRALGRSLEDLGLRGLAPLKYSASEAEAISALAEGDRLFLATGAEASRATVLSGVLSGYRIVHFATHALIHPRVPDLSGLVLATVRPDGEPEDGFLLTQEVYDLDLPADLVVLSACSTGLGREIRGEGLTGLAHGFFDAGAARLVVSLWRVSDQGAYELMKRFYRGILQRGLAPAAALRQAQLSMAREEEWSSPFYWGAFVLMGEWRDLEGLP